MLSKSDIEKYFVEEKQESLIFIGLGVVAIIIAISLLFFNKYNLWRGFAIPLVIIGLIQLVVGFTVFNRSDSDRIRVIYALDMNPSELKSVEAPRMETVMKNFVIYRFVEFFLILFSIVLVFFYKNYVLQTNCFSGKAFWFGFGIALFIQSVVMLSADYFAEKRGKMYHTKLSLHIKS